jgi:hypothetical protein
MRLQLRVRILRANFNRRWDLASERTGRRPLPPALIRRRRRGGQSQYRGVSATTRSDRVCDHARGHSRGRSRHAVPVSAGVTDLHGAAGAVRERAENLCRLFIGRRFDCAVRASLSAAEREIERIEVRRKKLIEMVMDGVSPWEVKDELNANAFRREELKAKLIGADAPPPLLHPQDGPAVSPEGNNAGPGPGASRDAHGGHRGSPWLGFCLRLKLSVC